MTRSYCYHWTPIIFVACIFIPCLAVPTESENSFSNLLRGRKLELNLGDVVARLLSSLGLELPTEFSSRTVDTVPAESNPVPLEVRTVRRGTVERVARPGRSGHGEGLRKGLKPQRILSQPLRILDSGPRRGGGRSLKEVEVQGVKIIVGERVPDSPEDKFMTWRNARVIQGHLIPNNEG